MKEGKEQAAQALMKGYEAIVAEEKKEAYHELVLKVFDDEKKDGMQQAIMDIISLLVKKE